MRLKKIWFRFLFYQMSLPKKVKTESNSNNDQILQLLNEMKRDMTEMKRDMTDMKKDMTDMKKDMNSKFQSFTSTTDNLKRSIDKIVERSSGHDLLNYLSYDEACEFPPGCGLHERKFYESECEDHVFESFRNERFSTYRTFWEKHPGLNQKSSSQTDTVEIDFLGVCNRKSKTKSVNLSKSPSKISSNSIGSHLIASKRTNLQFNTLVLFEVTTLNMNSFFLASHVPFSKDLQRKADTDPKTKSSMNILNKLLQLENNILFAKLYYKIEMDNIICGMMFPNVESNKFQDLTTSIVNALDNDDFKDCVPLVRAARDLGQFKIFI